MEIILLERIGRLGQMGDVVTVKDGYARNFLLPQKKALRATDENRARSKRTARNLKPIISSSRRKQRPLPQSSKVRSSLPSAAQATLASYTAPSRPAISPIW